MCDATIDTPAAPHGEAAAPGGSGDGSAVTFAVTFADMDGRRWTVALTDDAVSLVAGYCGVNLAELAHAPTGAGLARLVMMQPGRIREVLWVLCAAEVRDRGLSFTEFAAALDGFASVIPPEDDPLADKGRAVLVGALSALAQAVAAHWPASPFAASVVAFARGGAAA